MKPDSTDIFLKKKKPPKPAWSGTRGFLCLTLLSLLFIQGTATFCFHTAIGQNKPAVLKPGSPERKAIVDALREPVQKELKRKVIFRLDHLKAQNGFAFLRGTPQQPDGSAMEYKNTPYQQAIDDGAFDDSISALLKQTNGRWQVIAYVIGATDVPWENWDKKYKAPSAIFR